MLIMCCRPVGSNFRLVRQVQMNALSIPWGVWDMPTGKFLDFSPSEIVSGAIWRLNSINNLAVEIAKTCFQM